MEEREPSLFETGQVILFDKPLHWTSFDLVNKVRLMIRSELGIRKIKTGHAGTLDPLATGLMIILTGKATKRTDEFMDLEKEYITTIHLGMTTPSFDMETEVNGVFPTAHITRELVETRLLEFVGEQQQVPPLFSAKFIDGKRAYEFARKGHDRKLDPVRVVIKEIELIDFTPPEVTLRVLCSKGTYIRSLARDLGESLGSGGYLSALRRTAIGEYRIEGATDLEKFGFFLKQLKHS